MMQIAETDRLKLAELTEADAPFMLRLLNDPGWLRFIGDRNVRTVPEAEAYLQNGPMASYKQHGFGLWRVSRKADQAPIGICGILKRGTLPDPDIGFAFLPEFGGQGYAYEAAAASLEFARHQLRSPRVVAITTSDNERSAKLLEKLGLRFERIVRLPGDAQPVKLFSINFS